MPTKGILTFLAVKVCYLLNSLMKKDLAKLSNFERLVWNIKRYFLLCA